MPSWFDKLTMRTFIVGLILRACESFDLGGFRHESNQRLTKLEIAENRKHSQTLSLSKDEAGTVTRFPIRFTPGAP
jgi:hypothetical protein